MRLRKDPGWVISVATHGALLLAVLVGFSRASHVTDPHEAVPVELVDAQELDQVAKGERSAAAVKPQPRTEKRADVADLKPLPQLAEAVKDIAPPPAPAKRQPEPGQDSVKHDSVKHESKPPQQAAAPPPRPVEPPRPEPKPRRLEQATAETRHVPAKPPRPEPAEPLEPKPVQKPKVAQKVELKPEPPKEAKPIAAKKPEPRFEPDRLAKLLEQDKPKEPQKDVQKDVQKDAPKDAPKDAMAKPTQKPIAKPRSGDDSTAPEKRFDPTDITRFLSREAAQRKASAGQEFQQVASLGAPSASAAKMSPSLWSQLDGLLQEQYKQCWTFIGLGGQKKYIPEIQVHFKDDGSLAAPPELLNPPSDPNLKPLAESALRAVRRCDPLRIPARYQAYYEQWKGRIVRFDPEEML